jgi:SPX domain protein involved in polyphosphate accumulation
MYRLEYKYYIPFQFLDDFRNKISPYLKHDSFTILKSKKEYTVRSNYLDSRGLFTYHEKLAGIKTRMKFRIRGYNCQSDDSIVFLEIKRKDVESVSKDRASLLYSNLESFLRTKDLSLIRTYENDTLKRKSYAQNFLYYYLLYNLQPAVVVAYEREAFECKFGSGLRITIDKNVRARVTNSFLDLFEEERMFPAFKKYFVLEIKFNKVLPNWMPSIMAQYNLTRCSVPKYSLSIDAAFNDSFIKYLN